MDGCCLSFLHEFGEREVCNLPLLICGRTRERRKRFEPLGWIHCILDSQVSTIVHLMQVVGDGDAGRHQIDLSTYLSALPDTIVKLFNF
ncbi:hypothetical protein BHM03_00043788 [Ensete ventricosum]|nr:hypothetical protein BHM03_00043788 [Ensete ventricosum]